MSVSTSSGNFTIGPKSVACVIKMTPNSTGHYEVIWYVNGSTSPRTGTKNVGDLFFNRSRNHELCFWLGSGSEFYFYV